MSDQPTIPPIINKLMQSVIKSPLHGLVSKYLLLITFTGRKTGKKYSTPVSYSRKNGEVLIFTHANWWKNLQGGAPVKLYVRGKELEGVADPVADDKHIIAEGLTDHLRQTPGDAKFYDVSFDDQGNPISGEVARAVETVTMIRVYLS